MSHRYACCAAVVFGALLDSTSASQAQGNIWNSYAGSSSVFVSYSSYDSVLGNNTFPGSPRLSIDVNNPGGAGAGYSTSAIMDTGSTGLVISLTQACTKGVITCTGNSPQTYTPSPSAVIGYSTITYTSDNKSYAGFYTNAKVTISNASNTPEANAQIPIFVAVNIAGQSQSSDPAPSGVAQFGIGFGRGNATGVQLTDANGNPNGVTLYGKNFNAFMNLTSLSGVSNISSVAPGYVVTKTGVYLGLSSTAVAAINGPFVALTPMPQTPGSNVSAYAVVATRNEWQTPPIVARVSGNTSSIPVNGQYYATMLVDTGISDAIFTTGGTRINRAMITSPTVTNITIGLPGISGSNGSQSQDTYVYQGTCSSGLTNNVGCGPTLTSYNGGRSAQMVPVYPISSTDSFTNGYGSNNTGFADSTTPSPFLNAGVNFLNYFNVVYDPVSGFIGYLPNGSPSGVSASLLSVTPTLALQGAQTIPDGTNVTVPLYLFTAIGNQATPIYAPVDNLLSAASSGGQVTISQPIASDTIAGCTLANCSTGLVINQGTFIFNANNTYAGATAINSGATLALGLNGAIANSFGVTANGTFDISGGSGASIKSLAGTGLVSLGSQMLTITGGNNVFSGTIADGGLSGGTGGSVTIAGGEQVLNGINTYTGLTTVGAGSLIVNGVIGSAVSVESGGFLGGTGTVGPVIVKPGGTLAPGDVVGPLRVAGNLLLSPNSLYLVEAQGPSADRTNVTGTASLAGTVSAVFPSTTGLQRSYTILAAAGGRSGTFDTLAVMGLPSFLSASLRYTGSDVALDLRSDMTQVSGLTHNVAAVAGALDNAFNTAGGIPGGLSALYELSSANLPRALNMLSGEAHADEHAVLINEARYGRQALLGRMRQAAYAGQGGAGAALGYAGPAVVAGLEGDDALAYAGADKRATTFPIKAPPAAVAPPGRDLTFWAQGLGAWGKFDGNGNAADTRSTLAGVITGLDTRTANDWRLGFALGYSQSNTQVSGVASSALVDAALFGGYATTRAGAVSLRTGATYVFDAVNTSRSIFFPGFMDRTTAHYNAGTGQVFGEIGYGTAWGVVALEPFAGLAYVHLYTKSFTENGGAAALGGAGLSSDVGYSSLGLRVATTYQLWNGMLLTPRASLAWQCAFGALTPSASLAFAATTGAAFTVTGVPLARDAALIDAGIDLRINQRAKVEVSYVGQLASRARDNAVKGTFTWDF